MDTEQMREAMKTVRGHLNRAVSTRDKTTQIDNALLALLELADVLDALVERQQAPDHK
jgi:hypothetical protein